MILRLVAFLTAIPDNQKNVRFSKFIFHRLTVQNCPLNIILREIDAS